MSHQALEFLGICTAIVGYVLIRETVTRWWKARREALNRLQEGAMSGDDFERQMFALIDADKRRDR